MIIENLDNYIYLISIEGALRLPTTYDNHPSNSIYPIHLSTYSYEDDLSIEDLI